MEKNLVVLRLLSAAEIVGFSTNATQQPERKVFCFFGEALLAHGKQSELNALRL